MKTQSLLFLALVVALASCSGERAPKAVDSGAGSDAKVAERAAVGEARQASAGEAKDPQAKGESRSPRAWAWQDLAEPGVRYVAYENPEQCAKDGWNPKQCDNGLAAATAMTRNGMMAYDTQDQCEKVWSSCKAGQGPEKDTFAPSVAGFAIGTRGEKIPDPADPVSLFYVPLFRNAGGDLVHASGSMENPTLTAMDGDGALEPIVAPKKKAEALHAQAVADGLVTEAGEGEGEGEGEGADTSERD